MRQRQELEDRVAEVLEDISPGIAASVSTYLAAIAARFLGTTPTDEQIEAAAEEVAAETDLSGFDAIVAPAQGALASVGTAAVDEVSTSARIAVDANLPDAFNMVHTQALAYARDRAAEMVGKSWDGDVLVDNPDAEMAITETTRNKIKDLVVRALSPAEEEPFNLQNALEDLTDDLTGSPLFSRARAALIAQAEVGMAQNMGTLASFKALEEITGLKMKKRWSTAHDEKVCLELCAVNALAGAIPLDHLFPSGDLAPLAHPRCRCALVGEIDVKKPTAVEAA